MVMSPAYRDREQDKFKETPSGKTSVRVSVDSDTPVPVFITESSGNQSVSVFGEALSVPNGSVATLFTYVVPIGKRFILERIIFSGSNIARYSLYNGANLYMRSFTWFGDSLSGNWDFVSSGDGIYFNGGSVITMMVDHGRPFSGDFFSRMIGFLVDE